MTVFFWKIEKANNWPYFVENFFWKEYTNDWTCFVEKMKKIKPIIESVLLKNWKSKQTIDNVLLKKFSKKLFRLIQHVLLIIVGGEDDDLSLRVRSSGYNISRLPTALARYKMIKHEADPANPANPIRFDLLRAAAKRFTTDGLSNLKYQINRFAAASPSTRGSSWISARRPVDVWWIHWHMSGEIPLLN